LTEERQAPFLHRVGQVGASIGSRPPRSRPLRIALQAGIALVIFGFLVLTVASQWGELREEGIDFELVWLLPALVTCLVFYVLGGVGWDLILRFLGYRLSAARAQVAYGQPLLARYVPGSVLYVLGRLLLSERAGVPRRLTLASIVYEQAISACAALAIASAFLISHPDLEGQPLRWMILLVVPLAVLVLSPRVFGPLADRALRVFGREPLPATMPLRGILALLPFYAMVWAVAGLGVFFIARSVHYFPWSDLPTVGSAQSVGYVAALITLVAPAGLGIRDAAFAWAVKVALPSGSFAVGAAIAIAVRAVLTVVEVIYVGLVTVAGRREQVAASDPGERDGLQAERQAAGKPAPSPPTTN
jgi:glycosyltransferase 2 family protein